MHLCCKTYNNQTKKTTNQNTLSLSLRRQYQRGGRWIIVYPKLVAQTDVTAQFSQEMLKSVEEVWALKCKACTLFIRGWVKAQRRRYWAWQSNWSPQYSFKESWEKRIKVEKADRLRRLYGELWMQGACLLFFDEHGKVQGTGFFSSPMKLWGPDVFSCPAQSEYKLIWSL